MKKIVLLLIYLTQILYAMQAFAEISKCSMLNQTALYETCGIKSTKLEIVNSKEPLLVEVLTSSENLKSTLFYDKIPNLHLVDTRKIPQELEGRFFYQLDKTLSHDYIARENGSIYAIAEADNKCNIAKIMESGFSKIENASIWTRKGVEFITFKKQVSTGEQIHAPAGVVIAGLKTRPARKFDIAETLYNGIQLPENWVPNIDARSLEVAEVPYLKNIPEIINIDIGRQLFIDDFLIEKTDLTREFHKPQKYEGNPVLKPETQLETTSQFGNNPVAAPLSGSILWNPEIQKFQMWYEAGHVTSFAYAESADGIHWTRPELKVEKGTNRFLPKCFEPDSWTVFRDYYTDNPNEKFKMFARTHDHFPGRATAFYSADGKDWKIAGLNLGKCGDRSTMAYNPFRKKWIVSIRTCVADKKIGFKGRARGYFEADSFMEAVNWNPDEPVYWTHPDKFDSRVEWTNFQPQLYNLDCVAYESLMLGVFQIFTGPENSYWMKRGIPKATGLSFAYSRDGFNWHRPDRRRVIDSDYEEKWDKGYVQSISNVLCIMGDKLYIYYTAFAGDKSKTLKTVKKEWRGWGEGLYSGGATGIAFLRRDGFASMNSDGQNSELLTRKLKYSGSQLFINANIIKGSTLLAEICDAEGKPIEPYLLENCLPVSGDSTITQIKWRGAKDISSTANSPRRIRFVINGNGKIYSFWVSKDSSGRSDGYVAGGGKGFSCDRDTAGISQLIESGSTTLSSPTE